MGGCPDVQYQIVSSRNCMNLVAFIILIFYLTKQPLPPIIPEFEWVHILTFIINVILICSVAFYLYHKVKMKENNKGE